MKIDIIPYFLYAYFFIEINSIYYTMLKKKNTNMKNSFYTSLILLFTLSSFLKIEYSTTIPVDFGGYSAETENSLVVDTKDNVYDTVVKYLHESKVQDNKFFTNYIDSKIKNFHNLKLNKYIFPQIISTEYLHPDYIYSIKIEHKICILHQTPDDTDPLIS